MKKHVLTVVALSASGLFAYAATSDQPAERPGSVTVVDGGTAAPASSWTGAGSFAAASPTMSSTQAEQSPLQDPSTIVGLKLKNRPAPDDGSQASDNNWRSVKFETANLSYSDFCQAMKDKGANAITLRIADSAEEFIVDPDTGRRPTLDDLYDEVAKFVAVAKTKQLPVYLWERRWFTRDNEYLFINDLKEIVARTDRDNSSSGIAGVILTETQLTNGTEIRERAIDFATRVNQRAGLTNFLKNRTLVFPGGGLGANFRTIRDGISGYADYNSFYQRMDAQTGYFSWSFKHFGDFTEHPNYKGRSVAEKVAFMRSIDGLGLDSLSQLVTWGRNNGYYAQSHVIFWGDNADTVANMDDNERAATKEVLVTRRQWPGYFFNLAISLSTNERYDIERKVAFYNNGGDTYSSSNPGTVEGNDGPDSSGRFSGRLYSVWRDWRN